MSLSREERIELIRQVQELRDRVETIMDVLVPHQEQVEGQCSHPPTMIDDQSTMGEPLYVCRLCGTSQDHSFTVATL
jgi:hypothetical protein